MNPTFSKFYGYVFFEKHGETRQSPEEQASLFYEQWTTFFDLEEIPEEKFPDLQHPDLKIICLAAGAKGLSVCVFTSGHTAIAEIEWEQQDSETPSDFRKKADKVQAHLRNMSSYGCHIGSSGIYFGHSDDPQAAVAGEAAIWKTGSAARAEISGCGNLFSLGDHQYILLSPKSDMADVFLNRDFPLMEAAFHKLEFQEKVLRELEEQNQYAKTRVQKLLAGGWDESEPYFNDIRKYQTDLHRIIIRQSKLRQTLRINLGNLRELGKNYDVSNDSLFKPMTKRFDTMYRQIGYDLKYARLDLEETESQVQLLDLQISQKRLETEQQREKGQRRIECFLTFIGVFLAVGGATTNMPSTENDIRLALMFAFAVPVTLVWLLLPGLRKWKFNWKRFVRKKVGTKK